MEQMYPPEAYGASEHFPLSDYFEDFSSSHPINIPNCETDETEYLLAIKQSMGVDVPLSVLNQLSASCSIDLLTCQDEDTKNYPMKLPANINSTSKLPFPITTRSDNNLNVSKCLVELIKQRNPTELCVGNKRKYQNRLEFATPETPPDLKLGSDFIISVLIYRPIAFKYYNAKNASEKLRFNHEIIALGQNTLAELRDTILCSSDEGVCVEVESTSADLRPFVNAKSVYPSGFLFIDNVFYNDLRSTKAIDYSAPVMKWAREKKIKGLTTKNLENVTINHLKPRFGYPYVYMHQGDCEHLFVFADARLLDSSDCLHSVGYPHVLKLNRSGNKMCFMCTVSFAKWICVGSDRLPQHKVFLCTDCCNAYNYLDGEKLGTFKLYPYYEKHVLSTELQ